MGRVTCVRSSLVRFIKDIKIFCRRSSRFLLVGRAGVVFGCGRVYGRVFLILVFFAFFWFFGSIIFCLFFEFVIYV